MHIASCVITDEYDRLLLLHRSDGDEYMPHWELPGGVVAEDELPEDVAVQATASQLGLNVKLGKRLAEIDFETDDDAYKQHFFRATVAGGSIAVQDSQLYDDYDYFELDDLMELSLWPGVQLLQEKFWSGELVL